MAAAKTAETQLQRLAAEFGGADVKTRTQAGITLTYIGIDATIRRLNEVLGSDWSTRGTSTLTDLGEGKFLATVELYLDATVDGKQKSAFGVGADSGKDVDKALKTALAEALKKAAHQYGVALYLWDPAGRKRAERAKSLASGSEAALKKEVFAIARERTGKDKPTAAEVAACFDVKAGDLSDKDTLTEILTKEGVL